MMGFLKDLVDTGTSTSTMRWVLLFVIISTTIVFWGTWLIICILHNNVVDVPSGAVTAYASGNASAIAGKAIQRFAEPKETATVEPISQLRQRFSQTDEEDD